MKSSSANKASVAARAKGYTAEEYIRPKVCISGCPLNRRVIVIGKRWRAIGNIMLKI